MKEPFATLTPSNLDDSGANQDRGVISDGEVLDFPKSSRILRSADFRLVYDHGFRVSSPLFAAFCRARESDTNELGGDWGARLGLTVPRAVGKAVVRNRIKRRLREVFRLHRAKIAPKWDIVLNPRRAALEAEFGQIEREMGRVIDKCNSR